MKIAVVGLWHLGSVTAACLADAGFSVIAYDSNKQIIAKLQQGSAPLFEPGLDQLLAKGIKAKQLHITDDTKQLAEADIIWITFDTPVDDNDHADVEFVEHEIEKLFPYLKANSLILISSQIPVGTTRKLQQRCDEKWQQKNITFAYSPENLRLGKAIEVFTKSSRIVMGIQTEKDKSRIEQLLNPFSEHIIWMSIESAEMTKHALNAFLATSVVFINELAVLCEKVGANAKEVELGLKTEERIGPKAYLRPGAAFAGGTLARDVNFLIQKGQQQNVATPLFSSLLESNQIHKRWACSRILEVLKNLRDKTIVTLGLTYKAGTDTLRRSSAIETCEWLSQQGANVVAYDPVVNNLPEHLANFINLQPSLDLALNNADAVVVATEWPQFNSITPDQLLAKVKQPIIFDATGFLMAALGNDKRLHYYSVGKQACN